MTDPQLSDAERYVYLQLDGANDLGMGSPVTTRPTPDDPDVMRHQSQECVGDCGALHEAVRGLSTSPFGAQRIAMPIPQGRRRAGPTLKRMVSGDPPGRRPRW
jgi:hypothetical protein